MTLDNGQEFEVRFYGKSEVAGLMNISYSAFYRRMKAIETEIPEYRKFSKVLNPRQVIFILYHYGFLEVQSI